MTVRRLPVFSAILLAAMLAGGAAGGEPRPETTEILDLPRAGALCTFAILAATAEFGRRCRAGRNPELQAELDRSVSRLSEYVLQNSDSTPEQVAQFRHEQAGGDESDAEFCAGDSYIFYDGLASSGSDGLRSAVDRVVSRPGQPTWGTCL